MICVAVVSADDHFHRDLRRCAADAGLRVELSLRSAHDLRSSGGLDVVIVHRPSGEEIDQVREAVGSLPIVLAGPSADLSESIRNQDGWGLVDDDDLPVVAAAARAAAHGLSVISPRDPDPNTEDLRDYSLTPADPARGTEGRKEELTVREVEVLRLVASGATNREIAAALEISDNTVKYHLAGLYAKINVSRRSEVIFEAIRRGLITI